MNAAQQCSNLGEPAGRGRLARARSDAAIPGPAGVRYEALAAAAEQCTAINVRLWHAGHQALAQGTRDDGTWVIFAPSSIMPLLCAMTFFPRNGKPRRIASAPDAAAPGPPAGATGKERVREKRVRYDPRKPVVTGTPFRQFALCPGDPPLRLAGGGHTVGIRYNFGAMLDERRGHVLEDVAHPPG